MRVMSKQTKMNPRDIVEQAREYFSGQIGMSVKDLVLDCCAEFDSDIGFVTVQVLDFGHQCEVILTTREFEYQIMEFLRDIP